MTTYMSVIRHLLGFFIAAQAVFSSNLHFWAENRRLHFLGFCSINQHYIMHLTMLNSNFTDYNNRDKNQFLFIPVYFFVTFWSVHTSNTLIFRILSSKYYFYVLFINASRKNKDLIVIRGSYFFSHSLCFFRPFKLSPCVHVYEKVYRRYNPRPNIFPYILWIILTAKSLFKPVGKAYSM